jgi:hypothetical protein
MWPEDHLVLKPKKSANRSLGFALFFLIRSARYVTGRSRNLNIAERRKHPRVENLNLLSYVCKDDSGNPIKEGTGKTINISKRGILIETHNAFEWQDILLIGITTEDDLIRVKGKVIYCIAADFGMFRTGIQFLEPDEKILSFVISLLKTYL